LGDLVIGVTLNEAFMRTRAIASLAAILFAAASAWAQRPAPDTIPATGGDITIAPINHATLQITYGPQAITVDPTSQGTYTGLPAPTLILITDIHGDHLDPNALAGIRTASTTVVVPGAAAAQVPGAITTGNGDTRTIDGIQIEALPMYNIERGPSAGQLYHPKGRGNGYILTIGGRRIYIAGDTRVHAGDESAPEHRRGIRPDEPPVHNAAR
jgi:L-ascorbate metabolism protein UlaG (beta-lactamase superfamily)